VCFGDASARRLQEVRKTMTKIPVTRGRRRSTVLIATAAALLGLVAAPAVAATAPTSTAATPTNAAALNRLRQEVRAASVLHDHGVRDVCPRCDAEVVTTESGSRTPVSTTAPAGYSPAELATDYSLPATSTSTRTIAIIDAGVDPTLASDLATYRSTFTLPACTVANKCLRTENYDGGPQPAPQTGGEGAYVEEQVGVETSLDVDMASAACPTCHVLEISVPWQDAEDDNDVSTADFAAAVHTAVAAKAAVVSISYGFSADVTNTRGADRAAFAHPGVPITVSTGDDGFNGGVHQDWPSDLPTSIAVGGTTLTGPGKETAWYAAGSGCETAFPAANGQPASVTSACGRHRAAADVSADADPATGVAVYDTYAPDSGEPADWIIVGGTSASAPYVGGLYARAGKLTSVEGPNTLYAAPAKDFNDVTSGNNEALHNCADYPGVDKSLCNAGPGWDGPTGLGTPHGLAAF
jgi:hypothetical protein